MFNAVNEYKLLGFMFSPENYELIYDPRVSKSLFTENRRALFSAMQKCFVEYGSITLEGVELYYKDKLPGELFVSVTHNIDPIIDHLQTLTKKREIKELADKLTLLSMEDNPEMGKVESLLTSVSTRTDLEGTLIDGSVRFLGDLNQKISGEYQFVSTGYRFLDVMMGGEWPKQDISCIMADPGGSKTSIVCNSMLRMGNVGNASLLFSLEMGKQSLISRWISDHLSIDNMDLRLGTVERERLEEIRSATEYISTLPMYVIDDPYLSVFDMIPIIREYVAKHRIKVVFLDYLQIIKLHTDDKNKGLGEVASQLKNIAKKLNIHVCMISQKNGKDGVWAVRDSGEVPAVLDQCINLESDGTDNDIRQINIEFVKNRNGRLGKAPILFDGRYMRFMEGN